MGTFYFYSILGYYLFLILVIIRTIITYDLINKCKQNNQNKTNKCVLIFSYIRIIITSLLPFINTLLALSFLYFIICDDDTFNKLIEKQFKDKQ